MTACVLTQLYVGIERWRSKAGNIVEEGEMRADALLVVGDALREGLCKRFQVKASNN